MELVVELDLGLAGFDTHTALDVIVLFMFRFFLNIGHEGQRTCYVT